MTEIATIQTQADTDKTTRTNSVAAALVLYEARRQRIEHLGANGDLSNAERRVLQAVFALRTKARRAGRGCFTTAGEQGGKRGGGGRLAARVETAAPC